MDSYLDMLFDGLKGLEGRFIPKGWTATVVAGSAIGFGVVLTVLVFLLMRGMTRSLGRIGRSAALLPPSPPASADRPPPLSQAFEAIPALPGASIRSTTSTVRAAALRQGTVSPPHSFARL